MSWLRPVSFAAPFQGVRFEHQRLDNKNPIRDCPGHTKPHLLQTLCYKPANKIQKQKLATNKNTQSNSGKISRRAPVGKCNSSFEVHIQERSSGKLPINHAKRAELFYWTSGAQGKTRRVFRVHFPFLLRQKSDKPRNPSMEPRTNWANGPSEWLADWSPANPPPETNKKPSQSQWGRNFVPPLISSRAAVGEPRKSKKPHREMEKVPGWPYKQYRLRADWRKPPVIPRVALGCNESRGFSFSTADAGEQIPSMVFAKKKQKQTRLPPPKRWRLGFKLSFCVRLTTISV